MSDFVRILKKIGRGLRRAVCAIGRTFKFAGKRIARNSRTSKQNKIITKKERAIEELYADIGRNYYEAHGTEPEELLSELCGSVSANKEAVNSAVERIAELKEAYNEAKAEAKEKAKARRQADREAALAEKEAAREKKRAAAEADEDEDEGEPEAPAVFQQPDNAPVMEVPLQPVEEPVMAESASEPVDPEAEETSEDTEIPVAADAAGESMEADVEEEESTIDETPAEQELLEYPDIPYEPELPATESLQEEAPDEAPEIQAEPEAQAEETVSAE